MTCDSVNSWLVPIFHLTGLCFLVDWLLFFILLLPDIQMTVSWFSFDWFLFSFDWFLLFSWLVRIFQLTVSCFCWSGQRCTTSCWICVTSCPAGCFPPRSCEPCRLVIIATYRMWVTARMTRAKMRLHVCSRADDSLTRCWDGIVVGGQYYDWLIEIVYSNQS